METFFCVANQKKPNAIETANIICEYLKKHNKSCQIAENMGEEAGYLYTNPAEVPKNTDCIIVTGGDGTLIQAAGDLISLQIPFLGINCGTLGYLTEVESKDVYEALDQLLKGEYHMEERMILSGSIYRDGQLVYTASAVNDITVNRAGMLRIMDMKVFVNGEYLTRYAADGVIVSTPTGSTAYNLSAGGPIVSPKAKVLLMTPICAHTLNNRSIVFSPEDVLEIQIEKGRYEENEVKNVSFDGTRSFSVQDGDRIIIRQSKQLVKLVKLSKISFLEVLRKKLGDT